MNAKKKHRNCCKIADIAAEIANFELAPLEHMKENKNNSIVWICFADSFENDIFRNILSIKRTSHHCPHHNSSSAMYLESTSTSRENFLSWKYRFSSCLQRNVYRQRHWRIDTDTETNRRVASAMWTHPTVVVTQFTVSCAVELLRTLVTSDDIMMSLLKKLSISIKFHVVKPLCSVFMLQTNFFNNDVII